MILQSITLNNFKNYESAQVDFCEGINCLTGLNGSGKTNLLDAIYYLSLTKSAFNAIDSQNIRHDNQFFSIRANFEVDDRIYKLQCSLKQGEKKQVKLDGAAYEKLSEHIGKFPVVMIAPNDDGLIRDSSEVRRKFVDSIIAQTNKEYLEELIRYNHFLKQRNSLLKRMAESGRRDTALLSQYDEQIIGLSLQISKVRKGFVDTLLPEFLQQYEHISDGKEKVSIVYATKVLEDDFATSFAKSTEKDIVLRRTTMGVHRDDYTFLINDYPLKKIGSQGQQKSFLISLKLSQFEYIKNRQGRTPILLLDDIFDKLDDKRITKLLQMIAEHKFRQIFLTDARRERTENILSKLDTEVKIFDIEKNSVLESQ